MSSNLWLLWTPFYYLCWFPDLLSQSEPILNFWQLFNVCVGWPIFSANQRANFLKSFLFFFSIFSANYRANNNFLTSVLAFQSSHGASNNFLTAFWRLCIGFRIFSANHGASSIIFWQLFDAVVLAFQSFQPITKHAV